MKITEILNKNKELKEIKIPQGTRTLKDVPELRGIKYVKTLDANCVRSLVSLEGCPPRVDKLWCNHTSINSLEGGPKEAYTIWCCSNKHLASLEGCPEEVHKLWCDDTAITSLKGCSKKMNILEIGKNPQLILRNVWKNLHYCKIYYQDGTIHPDSGVLGLLRVNGLHAINCDNNTPLSIVKKYVPLRSMSDIMKCKQELIEAGFKSNARF